MIVFYYPVQPIILVDGIGNVIQAMEERWFSITSKEDYYGRYGPYPIITSYDRMIVFRV